MNLLEDAGGRVCGTDYMFCHALDPIPTDMPPMEALAQMALADPMVGSAADRAERIISRYPQIRQRKHWLFHASRARVIVPWKERLSAEMVKARMDIPILEIEVPPITDAIEPTLRTRLEALVETVKAHRERKER